MRDEPGTNNLTDKLSEVGGNNAHLINQVPVKSLAVVGEGNDFLSKVANVLHIHVRDILAHRNLSSIDNGLSNFSIIVDNGSKLVKTVVGECLLVTNEEN